MDGFLLGILFVFLLPREYKVTLSFTVLIRRLAVCAVAITIPQNVVHAECLYNMKVLSRAAERGRQGGALCPRASGSRGPHKIRSQFLFIVKNPL